MEILTFPTGLIQTNIYLCISGKDCVLVDAPKDAWETIEEPLRSRGLTLRAILVTHGHWDHIGGIVKIKRSLPYPVPVYAHAETCEWTEHPERMSPFFRMAFPQLTEKDFLPFAVDRILADGENFRLLDCDWRALYVPGHCPGSLAFYCGNAALVFTGDALFCGSVGRSDFPGGDYKLLCRSIREKLMPLPSGTRVLPGHGPDSTIGDESANNPYF
ncbi:MAG: MBL fold metallo-hydrolase [Opitutales bacterium]|nr:MBL fold metallo-hydrolase [Opitutales bacterium]